MMTLMILMVAKTLVRIKVRIMVKRWYVKITFDKKSWARWWILIEDGNLHWRNLHRWWSRPIPLQRRFHQSLWEWSTKGPSRNKGSTVHPFILAPYTSLHPEIFNPTHPMYTLRCIASRCYTYISKIAFFKAILLTYHLEISQVLNRIYFCNLCLLISFFALTLNVATRMNPSPSASKSLWKRISNQWKIKHTMAQRVLCKTDKW